MNVDILHEMIEKIRLEWPLLDECNRRMVAANYAMSLGFGGISLLHRACGLSRRTIARGIRDIQGGVVLPEGRVRAPGAGRKAITVSDPHLLSSLEDLINLQTQGDTMSPLRWTCESTRTIAAQLRRKKHQVSHAKIAQILHDLHYSLHSSRKGCDSTGRSGKDAQFQHINLAVRKCLAENIPVIAVETKRRNSPGSYSAPAVLRAYPYGIYDLRHSAGFVNAGSNDDTGGFAIASIRGWWYLEGRRLYPDAETILITANGEGNDALKFRLWNLELQKFANQTGLRISVCYFPPATSKWNNVEHRLFSFTASNWRGEPLQDYETNVALISRTAHAKELKVMCRLDRQNYIAFRKVSDKEMQEVNMERAHPDSHQNYLIRPSTTKQS